MQQLKITTWNVNGLRGLVQNGRTLKKWLEETGVEADILCVQETKLRRPELTRELAVAEGWDSFWCCCQPGVGPPTYSGVATFTRAHVLPTSVEAGLTGSLSPANAGTMLGGSSSSSAVCPQQLTLELSEALGLSLEELAALDAEGRALITDHGVFLLVNLYGPALTSVERREERLAYKLNFYKVLEWRMRRWLAAGRAVIVVGDLNIAPQPIDSCKPLPLQEWMQRSDRRWLGTCCRPAAGRAWPTRSGTATPTGRMPSPAGTRRQARGSTTTAHASTTSSLRGQLPQQLATVAQTQQPQPPATQQLARQEAAFSRESSSSSNKSSSSRGPPVLAGCWTASQAVTLSVISRGATMRQCGPRCQCRAACCRAGMQRQQPRAASSSRAGNQACATGSSSSNSSSRRHHNSSSSSSSLPARTLCPQVVGSHRGRASSSSQAANEPAAAAARRAAAVPAAPSSSDSGGRCQSLGRRQQSVPRQPQLRAMGRRACTVSLVTAAAAAAGAVVVVVAAAAAAQLLSNSSSSHCSMLLLRQLARTAATERKPAPARRWPPPAHAAAAAAADAAGADASAPDALAAAPVPADVAAALALAERNARDAWQRISSSMQPPRCRGHQEECVIRTVKKKGPNQGRQFWCCARADGPPPVGRCETFLWFNKAPVFKGQP